MNKCKTCKCYEPPRVFDERRGRCGRERRYPKIKYKESWACRNYESKEVMSWDERSKARLEI